MHDKLSNGRSYKMLTVLDEYTRQALCVEVKPRMGSAEVLEALYPLLLKHGKPVFIRSDQPLFLLHRTRLRTRGRVRHRIRPAVAKDRENPSHRAQRIRGLDAALSASAIAQSAAAWTFGRRCCGAAAAALTNRPCSRVSSTHRTKVQTQSYGPCRRRGDALCRPIQP